MRYSTLALAGALLGAAGLLAQQPPAQQPPAQQPPAQKPPAQAPAAAPGSDKLDEVLTNWERVMNGMHSLVAQVTRTSVNKTFEAVQVHEGQAKFLKPSYASLELRHKTKPQEFEKFVINGQEVYTWVPQSKAIQLNRLPKGKTPDDNVLSLVFGMKAGDAKKRYQMSLAPAPPPTDKYYYYVEILPRTPADKADFTRAQLVLTVGNYLPRRLWFQQPNGNEVTWDLTKLYTGVELRPAEFARPTPPQGWQMITADAPGAPAARVIRNQQQ
jgi:TIGR03009 family protein